MKAMEANISAVHTNIERMDGRMIDPTNDNRIKVNDLLLVHAKWIGIIWLTRPTGRRIMKIHFVID